ncbi:MAG: DNA recombination protein RmuC [Clostridia bacterium]|nr:DNA recombination protein RmuC [Clostridia bacterium]
MEKRLNGFSQQNETQLNAIRESVEKRLGDIQADNNKKLDAMRETVDQKLQNTLSERFNQSFGQVSERLSTLSDNLREGQTTLGTSVTDALSLMEKRLNGFSQQNETQLNAVRESVEKRLGDIQADNNKKLDAMREVVDEKLQKTLTDRLNQSFGLVSERLEQVSKGLGEMQTLASGVGDLKKVLSNVKTRGIMGEIQLGAILEQILAPTQYACNVATKKGSRNVVEYAILLPGDGDVPVYLPIDAKFPADLYSRLMDAYDSGDQTNIAEASKELTNRIRQCAKDIHDKYIDPPNTTDFGILFLPFEGLYAEVVRRDMVETLSREYKITIAGPTTMAALLNSLQMGFRTLALQKRSSEVWDILAGVKTEFEKFGGALEKAQKKISEANSEIDNLVGTRTRAIRKKLSGVTALPENETQRLFAEGEARDENY